MSRSSDIAGRVASNLAKNPQLAALNPLACERLAKSAYGTIPTHQRPPVTTEAPKGTNIVEKRKKPEKMTRAEQFVEEMLRRQIHDGLIASYAFEAITLTIGEDRCRYTGDFAVFLNDGRLRIVEAKGGHIWEDSIVKFKVAKRSYPMIDFELWQWKSGCLTRLL